MHTAIIIEPRKHAALEFVLKNMLTCLPNTWKLVFFHGSLNKTFAEELFNSLEECQKNRLQLVDLQIENLNQKTYSQFLATRTIIYDYIQTDYFLVFQTDSILFEKYIDLLNVFISENYDYVGSPWRICGYEPTRCRGFIGNGGLSLRKTSKMLEIIEKYNWNNLTETEFEWLEDLYFTNNYSNITMRKPPYELAKLFSVDEVYSEISVGCHKPWVHAHYNSLAKIHPEVETLKMLQYNL